ncbi:hypothetical protein PHLGIDRAFT_199839 [Phlebiopsis gigantea 11061_1 CR5-6]|uniref:DUF6534 domain-containing protein n=1 Tax=Phlebiopsis gigantea (strain 11061_1 CR5-6) TaxID=745531 RepID=A0A0C3S3F5_PHLG1|nr:hypothetical protein PHLGIDRAFT_199839 [Phlebiopsis gigantea 11061_1 CR5-6]
MVYLLLRNKTEIAETRTLITKLVRIIIEGGTLTASAAILALILWYAFPHREYYTAVATILGKLYSNSLLAIFNSRSKFAGNHSWKTDPLYLTYKPGGRTEKVQRTVPMLLMPLRKRTEQPPAGIHVQQEVCVVSESDSMKVPGEIEDDEAQKSPALV